MLTKQYILSQEENDGQRRNDLRRKFNVQQLEKLQGGITKQKRGIAIKTDPKKWNLAKQKACTSAGLCKHSARKMQWATRWYKSHGGKYKGKKSPDNKLSKWGRQKWRTSSGKKSGGKLRYLPDKAWKKLSKKEINATNKAKAKGYAKGKQWVRQPKNIAKKTSRYRK